MLVCMILLLNLSSLPLFLSLTIFFSYIIKNFFNVPSPMFHFFLCRHVFEVALSIVSLILQFFKVFICHDISWYFFNYLWMVHLKDHSFAHSNIWHQQWSFLDVLNQNKLFLLFWCQWQWFIFWKFFIKWYYSSYYF